MPAAPSPALRKLFAELEELFQRESQERVSSSVLAAERALAEHLNQSMRRLRQAAGFKEVAAVVRDASTPFCRGCAVFRVNQGEVAGECARGTEPEAAAGFGALRFSASEGEAVASAIDSREPTVTLCSATQLSSRVAGLFPGASGSKAFLFPIVAGQTTSGLICAVSVVESAPMELLAQSAGAALEAQKPFVAEDIIQIAPAPVRRNGSPGPDWDALSPAERSLHLRAQRFARVQVAEMRLYQSAAVETGRAQGDLYSALRAAIEEGREAFRRNFVTSSPSMADYFHLELVRTLANDNPAVLGEKYPGPLV